MSIYKNNSDGKGNSYGTHENYLVDRAVPFGDIVRDLTPFFVTRQVFTGAGKVGAEAPWDERGHADYQLTQRADFFETEVGLETTLKRPIVNTRDEPHADPEKYRRLHVIVGDANLCEVATFLKVGTTAIVLKMIEDDFLPDFSLVNPVAGAARGLARPHLHPRGRADGRAPCHRACSCSGSTSSSREVRRTRGRHAREPRGPRALGVHARRARGRPDDAAPPARLGREATACSRATATRDEPRVGRPEAPGDRPAVPRRAPRQGPVLPAGSLGQGRALTTDDEVERAVMEPPEDTRAYFRGRCISKYPDAIAAASWDSLIVDTGADALQRIPMREPLRGTKQHVDGLLAQAGHRRAARRTPPGLTGSSPRTHSRIRRTERSHPVPQEQEQKKVQKKGGRRRGADADAGQVAVVVQGRGAQGRDGRDPRRDRLGAGGERRGVREVLRPEGRRVTDPVSLPSSASPFGANPSFVDLLRREHPDSLARLTQPLSAEAAAQVPHGTTVLGLKFADGIVMAGDRRATAGYTIADDKMRKVFAADDYSAIAIAGAAGRRSTWSSSSSWNWSTTRRSPATGCRWRARPTGWRR